MVTEKERELSVDEVSAILPDEPRFRWFVLVLKYTGWRVFVNEEQMDDEQHNPNSVLSTIIYVRDENGAWVAFDNGAYWWSYVSTNGVRGCLRGLVADALSFQTNGVVRFKCGGRAFECPVSATKLKMKLELMGRDV